MMLKKLKEASKTFELLPNEVHVTVALSGGADSMALLDALIKLQTEFNIKKISAAHFNHNIRGDEALRDQRFVEQQCKMRNIECFTGSADVPEFAKEQGVSIELAARKLRYEFFDGINTDLIATAHTASDNIETVIFNLARGTALSGLGGIPPKRDKYIRPLILCTRNDIEEYCAQNRIDYVTDSTNLSDDYTRNNIRHNIVPKLKQLNESVEVAVSRMVQSVREDEDFINGCVDGIYNASICENGLLTRQLVIAHPSIAKRVIVRFCNERGVELDYYHINAIYKICLSSGKTSLLHDKSAIVKDGLLIITDAKLKPANINFNVAINKKDNNFFKNNKKINSLLLKNIIDCDKIIGKLSLRTRQSGDSIRLKNKNCTKTLKKLFCEYKIPLGERENLPVLCDDLGVVWIHKIGVADRCAADENSKQIYEISIEKIL